MHFPWSTDLEPWIVDSVSRFKLLGSRLGDAGLGYWGWVRDLDRLGLRGVVPPKIPVSSDDLAGIRTDNLACHLIGL